MRLQPVLTARVSVLSKATVLSLEMLAVLVLPAASEAAPAATETVTSPLWPMPLTAIQLLWMNLLTDGAPALALGMENQEPGIMDRPPRPASQPIIDRSMMVGLALQGIAITAVSLVAFRIGAQYFGSADDARTMAFVTLSGCQILRAYTNRSERASVFSLGVFSNRWMQYAALSSTVLMLAVVYVPGLNTVFNAIPLSLAHWARLAPLLVIPAVVDELAKLALRSRERSREKRSRA